MDTNSLILDDYLIKEIDNKNNITISHFQFSILQKEYCCILKEFYLKKYNIEINDNGNAIIIDISFFRDKPTFEKLLRIFLQEIIKLNYINNNIIIIIPGTSYLDVLELWGAKVSGIISDKYVNLYVMEINSLKLLSNKYIIHLLRK
ncbi:hypothetical protein [Aliivibrio fischeri]|uniref:hypothetical protein n=1 Tax=Aliivibrio fischeri TaxID=668 RepID=UPI00114CED78|nr:hypothetical protein [Aliivibrio fischeri]